jgi:hypothetical protein
MSFVDDYSVPPHVSDDIEMLTPQDVKDFEGHELETHEQGMDDLFGQDDDHPKESV